MTARVLVVDDTPANIKLLEARLSSEYFEVLTATNGPDALTICMQGLADVVLLDVMMPGMDGFEVCRRLKASARTQHIPVIIVTALDSNSDKIQGLEAGADDFLVKPYDEVALMTRVRNLVRLKLLNDQMRMRASTSVELGIDDWTTLRQQFADPSGRVLVVEDFLRGAERMADEIGKKHSCEIVADPQAALFRLAEENFDLAIISLGLEKFDGLRLCSQIRSIERTRNLPIIVMNEPGNQARLMRALDLGVNDYLTKPIDRNEMLARIKTQIRRKRHSDFLRNRLEESVEAAIIDPLTGLHNRRYMDRFMRTVVEQAHRNGKALSMLVADIDHFKSVNDRFGHDAGDSVLKEFSARLKGSIRGVDLACRLGGEEFVVIMPETTLDRACQIAERLRVTTAAEPFKVGGTAERLTVTASVGVSSIERLTDTPEHLLKRADEALYVAKRGGRNRVVSDAA